MTNRPAAARHCNQGFALFKRGDPRGAIKEFERAIKADASLVESHWLRGLALCLAGRAREAETALAALRRRHSNNADICHAHSEALLKLGRGEEMRRAVEDGLRLAPGHFSLLQQRVHASRIAGDIQDAIAYALRALNLQPDLPAARLEIGLLLMLTGSPRSALGYYDGRHAGMAKQGRRWLGEETAAPVTVLAEQGLGDVLQVCRFYPAIARRAAAATFHVQTSLIGLLSRNFPDLAFRPQEAAADATYYAWCMDLPGLFEGGADAVATPPYLRADPDRHQDWAAKLPATGLKVGLSWQGNPDFRHDAFRSLPLERFAPLSGIENVHLISLRIEPPPRGTPVVLTDFSKDIHDFEDTAALIACLDLVITTDTSVAHLAGAMGKETWLLLQRPYDWRWGTDGETSPLYPSMRLLREMPITDLRARLLDRQQPR